MKKYFCHSSFMSMTLAALTALAGCANDPVENIVIENIVDEDPTVFKFWLVHEYYTDTQRTTKVILDAGPGKNFKAEDFDKDTFRVHALLTHYYEETEGGPSKVVSSNDREVTEVYVTPSIDNINELAKRDLMTPQAKLPEAESGRYLVLELASDRPYNAETKEFGRRPGAESAWNDTGSMIQHKMDYSIIPVKAFKRYGGGGDPEEVEANTTMYSFAQSARKYNKNEILPGHISVIFNLLEPGQYKSDDGDYTLNYRFYKPAGSYTTGSLPLFIWLHGMDGTRIAESAAWPSGVPEFLQNTSQIIHGGLAQIANPANQDKYGPYYVLAPQAPTFGHVPAQIKALVDQLMVENPAIDPRRIYIGGHSMGGMGSINMCIEYPNFIAAAITGPGSLPWGGGADEGAQLAALARVPIWLVTIDGDNTGMDRMSVYLFDRLVRTDGSNVRLTYYTPEGVVGNNGAYQVVPTSVPAEGDAVVPAGFGWAHSGYEPMMSNKITTDDPHNVASVDASYNGSNFTKSMLKFGRKAEGDTAGDTLFDWLFKQRK